MYKNTLYIVFLLKMFDYILINDYNFYISSGGHGQMINMVLKRDGTYQPFNKKKIADAIYKNVIQKNEDFFAVEKRLIEREIQQLRRKLNAKK